MIFVVVLLAYTGIPLVVPSNILPWVCMVGQVSEFFFILVYLGQQSYHKYKAHKNRRKYLSVTFIMVMTVFAQSIQHNIRASTVWNHFHTMRKYLSISFQIALLYKAKRMISKMNPNSGNAMWRKIHTKLYLIMKQRWLVFR